MILIDDFKYKTIIYYGIYSVKHLLRTIRSTDGTSAMIFYRLSQIFKNNHLGFIAYFLRGINRILNGCWIGRNVDFGKGFVIMHPYGIVINSSVRGGKNIVVQSGVIIGVARDGEPTEVPKLGNNIFIGSGAKILGGVKVGDNVKIGANAVVVEDVPDNSTAVGIPGKIIKRDVNEYAG